MRVIIGLDVPLAKTAIDVVDREGAVQGQRKVPSEPAPLIKGSRAAASPTGKDRRR
jgi:hypothetical protein